MLGVAGASVIISPREMQVENVAKPIYVTIGQGRTPSPVARLALKNLPSKYRHQEKAVGPRLTSSLSSSEGQAFVQTLQIGRCLDLTNRPLQNLGIALLWGATHELPIPQSLLCACVLPSRLGRLDNGDVRICREHDRTPILQEDRSGHLLRADNVTPLQMPIDIDWRSHFRWKSARIEAADRLRVQFRQRVDDGDYGTGCPNVRSYVLTGPMNAQVVLVATYLIRRHAGACNPVKKTVDESHLGRYRLCSDVFNASFAMKGGQEHLQLLVRKESLPNKAQNVRPVTFQNILHVEVVLPRTTKPIDPRAADPRLFNHSRSKPIDFDIVHRVRLSNRFDR